MTDGADAGKSGMANYEDPNCNVSLPVFSIHGNHDDPAGEGERGIGELFRQARARWGGSRSRGLEAGIVT